MNTWVCQEAFNKAGHASGFCKTGCVNPSMGMHTSRKNTNGGKHTASQACFIPNRLEKKVEKACQISWHRTSKLDEEF